MESLRQSGGRVSERGSEKAQLALLQRLADTIPRSRFGKTFTKPARFHIEPG
jgi:hypothetical protein